MQRRYQGSGTEADIKGDDDDVSLKCHRYMSHADAAMGRPTIESSKCCHSDRRFASAAGAHRLPTVL